MAAFAFTDAYFVVNGGASNLSSYTKAVTLHVEGAELDATSMTSSSWMVPIVGMKSGNIQLTFNQDIVAAALDAIVYPLLFSTVTFELRSTSSAVSTSNPKWTGSFLAREWNPVSGSVGDLAAVTVTWPLSGALTRATS